MHSLETSPQWLVCFSIEQGNELEGVVTRLEKKDQEEWGIVTIVMLFQLYLEVKNVNMYSTTLHTFHNDLQNDNLCFWSFRINIQRKVHHLPL